MDNPLTISLQELPDTEAVERAREEAQERLAESGSRLARLKWSTLRDATASCMQTKLGEIDPFSMLASAWGKAAEVRQLAAETRANGSEKPYPVGKHSLSASFHPIVTLRCGPLVFPALTFTVTIEGIVDCATLIIARGRLHSVEALSLGASMVLSYDKKELKRLTSDQVPFGRPYVFKDGGIEIP